MAIKTTDVQPNPEGKYSCPECERHFDDRSHLGIHRRSHGVMITHRPAVIGRSPMALDSDRVAKAIALSKQGLPANKVAAQLGISTSTVYKYVRGTRGQGKVGRPLGAKNVKPYRLKQPIVLREEDVQPVTTSTPIVSIADHLRHLSLKAHGLAEEITEIFNLLSPTKSE